MDITVLSPMAEEYLEPEAKFAGARSDSLRGKTVGILENGWTSMSALAETKSSGLPVSAPATPTDAPTLSGTPTTSSTPPTASTSSTPSTTVSPGG